MHAPVPARKQQGTFQLWCLISLFLTHVCAEQVQTHSPPGTLRNAHAEPASRGPPEGPLSAFLPASLCRPLSVSPFLFVSASLPSLLCLSSTTCPSGHTYTHAHTQTDTHAGLLCPRLTDQQHHGDLSTRRTLFAESRWSEKDKNVLLTGRRPNWWAKGQRE